MIGEIVLMAVSELLAEIARKFNLNIKIEIRERVLQLHHNLIGFSFLLTSIFTGFNPFFLYFGSGLVLHHLIREGW